MYNGKKIWNLSFDDGTVVSNSDLAGNSLSIRKSLSNEKQIRFGKCIPASITFSILNKETSLLNEGFIANLTVCDKRSEDAENSNLGKFYVASEKLSSDKKKRSIEAYDALYSIVNADVSAWYNSLNFPISLNDMLSSFLGKFEIQQVADNYLPNGTITIDKTISPESISGKKVLECICELNGCYGIMDGDGKFKTLYLGRQYSNLSLHDYTRETHEDFTTQSISKLQIRQEDNDIGVTVGTGSNTYIIQDNFLVYGKSTEELTQIANNILNVIKDIVYTPCNVRAFVDVNVEIGTRINVSAKNGDYTSYILEQNIIGINSTKAEYTANGAEKLNGKANGIQDSIIQLKGKSNVLERSIEQTRITISDVEQGLSSQITQNANSITAEINRATSAEDLLNSRIVQTDDKITLEVSRLQKEIDGDIRTYNVDYVPTLLNYPAWDWTYNIPCNDTVACDNVPMLYTDEYYSRNARSTVFNESTFITYKFIKGENGEWYFREVADSDYSYVMQQLSEINIEIDSITSTVSENKRYSDGKFSEMSSQITQTASSITAEVNRASSEEGKLSTRITQTADSITSEVTRATQAEGNLSSRITQNTDSISLKVSKNSIISEINQTAEAVTIKANKIDLVGVVNATEFTSRYATIDSLNATNLAVSGKASIEDLKATNLEVSKKATLNDVVALGYIKAKDVNGNVTSISGSAITTGKISADRLDANAIMAKTTGTVSCAVSILSVFGSGIGFPNYSNIGYFRPVRTGTTSQGKAIYTLQAEER